MGVPPATDTASGSPGPVDFFVSYTAVDEAWAQWVAWQLEAAGYTTLIQAWDFGAGAHFVTEMHQAAQHAARTVAVLSTAYLSSAYAAAEWQAAWERDPSGQDRKLLVFRIEDCSRPGLLGQVVGVDLFDVDPDAAAARLVAAARGQRGKPPAEPSFPGGPARRAGLVTEPVFPGRLRVADADPYRLGVHRAIQLSDLGDNTPPVYVERDIDRARNGVRAQLRTAAGRGGFVLLVGGSSVGKTRCAVEAVKAELADWRLIHPASATQITALATAPPAQSVLWLDELQKYFDGEHGLTAGVLRALLDAASPVVIVGTLWPEYFRHFTAHPKFDELDSSRWERDVLRLAAVVDVDDQFSTAEQERASHAATQDRRIQAGLDNSAGYGLTQTLAAAPELLRRWTSAHTDRPYAWAVLTAAVDAARLGARAALTAGLLRDAAPDYCTPRQQATAPANWFENALIYATEELHGAAAALAPTSNGMGMGMIAGYTVADYLLQEATRTRRGERPPASLWAALRDHPTHPDDLTRLTETALNYRVYTLAVPLLRQQADAGDGFAAGCLAALLAEAGDQQGAIDLLRPRADAGDWNAAIRLADLLAESGDWDELRRRADADDVLAASRLAKLLAEAGDQQGAIDLLRPRADADGWDAASWLADLLAEPRDRDELRQRADADYGFAASWLAEEGDHDELRQRANAGDWEAAIRLPELLVETKDRQGAINVLRPRADAGDWEAAARLADLLAEEGDQDKLRQRADAGDVLAASRLADLLAEEGDQDKLRQRADAGDRFAASGLADMLAKSGDKRLRRYGFALDGRIADGPTW
ncbi:toll/interleukin-1 receptor domain-containing protein [Frankia sp. AiPs1]|uniref:toll/interleukin-1 receptor domain-containing protein n=1 Tax=Frankia sp. AiPs1 TaxID=573493 RepID=UPI002042C407|nr:toll/interleukin-1 receptor domain-containing protein [Frankia sp. AiPs1]MCM3920292.1 toll/interleukin-1 receptor domain-containing protein [Frankia sp. AiPs1]